MADERLNFVIGVREQGAVASLRRLADKLSGVESSVGKVSRSMQEFAGVSERLTKLEDKHSDALGKVKLAEQNLSEVRDRASAKVSQVLRAENQLLKARRDAARAAGDVARAVERAATPDGESSGRSFTSRFGHWLTGAGGKDLHDAGKGGASAFGGGFLAGVKGALGTPILGPALVAALVAVAASVLPAVGAVLAGGIVAGFGAGLAGLGLAFAAKAQGVRDAWKSTLSRMGSDMRILATPFENALLAMASVAARTFARFKPALAGAFATLGPAVSAFGDQLGIAFGKLAPAVQPLADAFGAVLRSLGPALQTALGSIAAGLIALSTSVQNGPAGLANMVIGLGQLTQSALGLVGQLNDVNAAVQRLLGVDAVTIVFKALTGVIEGTRAAFGGLLWPLILLDKILNPTTASVADLGQKATLTGGATADMAGQVAAFAASAHPAAAAAETMTAKLARQTAATNALIANLHRLSGETLSLRGAQTSMAQAVADATSAVAANGRTLSLNSQKGRDNRNALDGVAQAANAQSDAMLRAGASNRSVAAAAATARARFVTLATQMGMTRTQAQALANKVIDVQAQINKLHGKTVEVKYTSAGVLTWSPAHTAHGTMATGGQIRGPGGPTADRAGLFALSNNEWVVKAASARKYGDKAMSSVNSGTATIIPGMAAGGPARINIHSLGVFKTRADENAFLNKMFGATSTPGAGAGVQKWAPVALAALRAAGAPPSWLPSLLRRMNQESGGNAHAINLTDSNARAGDPSRGLMQTIGSTFAAYAGRYRSRGIYDPFANIFAAIQYTIARYGSGPAGWNRPGGYALGGKVNSYRNGTPYVPYDGLAYLHRGERVTPASRNASQIVNNFDFSGAIIASEQHALDWLTKGIDTLKRQRRM